MFIHASLLRRNKGVNESDSQASSLASSSVNSPRRRRNLGNKNNAVTGSSTNSVEEEEEQPVRRELADRFNQAQQSSPPSSRNSSPSRRGFYKADRSQDPLTPSHEYETRHKTAMTKLADVVTAVMGIARMKLHKRANNPDQMVRWSSSIEIRFGLIIILFIGKS